MLKSLEKRCCVSETSVNIRLTDTRDNYVVATAMGEVGTITMCKEGVFIYPSYESIDGLDDRRERTLYEAYEEIFGTKEFDPLSSYSYDTIQVLIKNGTLTKLEYTIHQVHDYENDDLDELEHFNKKKPGRR